MNYQKIDFNSDQVKEASEIKVINIFGAPSSGKSTAAAGLFWHMKCAGMSVELVSEYAKSCVFEDRMNLLNEDQLYIFAKQHRALFRIKDTYEYAIMDSPIILSSIYRKPESFYDEEHFNDLLFSTFNKYDNINFLIKLNKDSFETRGRIHDVSQSQEIQKKIERMLILQHIPYISCGNIEVVDIILRTLTKNNIC